MNQLKFITKLRGLIVLVLVLMISEVSFAADVITAIGTTEITAPTSGNYYVIAGASQHDGTVYLYDNGSDFKGSTTAPALNSNANLKYVWKITGNDTDGWVFQNMYTGNYINIDGTGDGGDVAVSTTSKTINISVSGTNVGLYNSSDQYIDVGYGGSTPTTWSGGVSGSRTLTIYEATIGDIFAEENRPYAIKHSSGLYVDLEKTKSEQDGSCATLQSAAYPYYFAASGDNWTIQSCINNNYMNASSWSIVASESSFDWSITGTDESFTMQRGSGSGNISVNTDASTAGSGVYCDKASCATFSLVPMYKITSGTCENGSVSVDGYEYAVEGATVTLDYAADGYRLNAYTVTKTGDAATTIEVTNGTFTMPAYDVTVTATFDAFETIKPEDDTPYALQCITGTNIYLDLNSTGSTIKFSDTACPVKFVKGDHTGDWKITNVDGDKYFALNGEWNTTASTSSYTWLISDADEDNINFTIQRGDGSTYVGADSFTSGSGIYSDKSGDKIAYFTLVPMYKIAAGTCEHGAVTTDGYAIAGSTVTLTSTPEQDYTLNEYTITKTGDASTTVEVTEGTFIMPAYDVTVTASFNAPAVFRPVFSIPGGEYTTGELTIELTSATDDATIYYTTDNSDPKTSATRQTYNSTDKITISADNVTIRAIAEKDGTYSAEADAQTYYHPEALIYASVDRSTLYYDGTIASTANVDAVTATGFTNLAYSSSNTSVATVDETTGVITAVAEGTATITVTPTAQTGYVVNGPITIDITVASSTTRATDTYSTTWTGTADGTPSKIYLLNKATGLYLGTGGRWGTEGLLKTTGLPLYLSKSLTTAGDIDEMSMYSSQTKACNGTYDGSEYLKWGFVSSANIFDPIKIGLYNDANDNYSAQTFGFKYNSDDNTYSVYRDGMSAGIEITYFENGEKYYLAPSVGSCTPLKWSTSVYYWTWDATNNRISANKGGTQYLYNNNGEIGLTGDASTAATWTIGSDDAEGILKTSDNYYLTYGGIKFNADAANAASAKAYTSTDKFYLTRTGGETARANNVTELQYTGTIPDEARWFVVTQADMIKDFDNATASDAQPKEATFYLTNNDFSRNVDTGWSMTDDDQTRSYETLPYTRFGDALYNYAGPTKSTNTNGNNGIEDLTTGTVKTTTSEATLGLNGESYTILDADVTYAGVAAGQQTCYHAIYAGYYNCRIVSNGDGTKSGSTDARKIYQRLTGLRQGWYKISCDGYKYTPTAGTGTATLYAKHITSATDDTQIGSDKENNSVTLPEVTTYENMTQAGITFYNNGNTSAYRNSLMVYVPWTDDDNDGKNDNYLEIGVSVEGGTFSNAAQGDANTFAEVDAFQLQYTGDPDYDIVLDEDFYDAAHKYTIDGASVDYINAQVYNEEGKTSRTLYLKRSMKAGKWNSFTLPINITAGSLKTAFGDNVELAAFDNCTDNLVTFTDVDISTDTKTAITAGNCYVIKPEKINGQTSGTYSTKVARSPLSDDLSVTASINQPVFIFNNVEFTSTVDVNPYKSDKMTPEGNAGTDYMTDLQVQGTYFKDDAALLFGSYALSNGSWVRFTKKNNDGTYDTDATNPSKGFRCWIGRVASNDGNGNAKLTMIINGEEYEATGIDGITAKQSTGLSDNRVFSISGQLMGTAESMNKLPKGIYIINGKKYIVK